jgi:hypothetical protein
VREGRGKEQEHPDEEEELETTKRDSVTRLSVAVQTNRVVPTKENDDSHKRVPREFDKDVGNHEGLPRVGLARTLANLVQGALSDEVRHDLLDQLTEDSHQHENGEHLVLQTHLRVGHLVERKSDKKR